MAQAPEGEGCPRCGAYVYAAEQMLARGRVSFEQFIFNSNFKPMGSRRATIPDVSSVSHVIAL